VVRLDVPRFAFERGVIASTGWLWGEKSTDSELREACGQARSNEIAFAVPIRQSALFVSSVHRHVD
jgi:hypothetical protein